MTHIHSVMYSVIAPLCTLVLLITWTGRERNRENTVDGEWATVIPQWVIVVDVWKRSEKKAWCFVDYQWIFTCLGRCRHKYCCCLLLLDTLADSWCRLCCSLPHWTEKLLVQPLHKLVEVVHTYKHSENVLLKKRKKSICKCVWVYFFLCGTVWEW